MRIGELARRCNVSTDTLRHYERRGVLPRPRRTSSGYRVYAPEALTRVRTIRAALGFGIGLTQLAAIFAERSKGRVPCTKVRAVVTERLRSLDAEIEELTAIRDRMRDSLQDWNERARRSPADARLGHLESLTRER